MCGVLAKNKTDRHVRISEKQRLGMLYELNYENVFFAEVDSPRKPSPKG